LVNHATSGPWWSAASATAAWCAGFRNVRQPLLGPDLGRGVGRLGTVEVGEHDPVAAGDQPLRDPPADPARTSGHHHTAAHGPRVSHDTRFEQVFEIGGRP
jgi:hypothetical protein